MELDAGVGEILNKLRQLKIERDTFVLFSSDNGAATYAFTEGWFLAKAINGLLWSVFNQMHVLWLNGTS